MGHLSLARLSALVDRLVPARYASADRETLRQVRLCLMFMLFMETQAAGFTALYVFLGMPRVSLMVALAGAAMLYTPRALARSLPLGTNFFVAVVVAVLMPVAFYTGGPAAPAAWWLVSMPVAAMLLGGRRTAVRWAAGAIVVMGAATAATLAGFEWQHRLSPDRATVLGFVGFAALVFVMLGFALLYEQARERMVAGLDDANRDMRLVLENVGQGFLTLDATGRLPAQRSRVLDDWFGPAAADDTLWSWLGRANPELGAWLPVAWTEVFDQVLPLELTVAQLPGRFSVGARTHEVEYRPLLAPDGGLARLLVVVSDVTQRVAAERAEGAQRELMAALERVADDRAGFIQFWRETNAVAAALPDDPARLLRLVHTLKGNCAIYGVRSVAERCHAVESTAQERGEAPTAAEVASIVAAWRSFSADVARLVEDDGRRLEVEAADYAALCAAIAAGAAHPALGAMVESWRHERTEKSLGRVAEVARELARRLGRGAVEVAVEHGDLRLDVRRWRPVWSAFIHAVRNAVDHGLEPPEERAASGKSEAPRIRLTSAAAADGAVVLEIADNGRGVDWARVAEKARAAGLPWATAADLHDALFADGLSTRDEVSELSGRGVGLAALREAAEALGGRVEVRSEPGRGTTLRVEVPGAEALRLAA